MTKVPSMYRSVRAARSAMTDRSESTFGNYTLLERIGVGGMAEAYLAQRHGASHRFVVKLIHEDASEITLARMRQEAHAGIYFDHPNIVRTLDAGTISGTFFVAVELVVGVDLRRVDAWHRGRQRPVPPELVVGVMRQTLRGLAYAHAARGPNDEPLGIVHRDLSPANLMLDDAGCVKVIDFGLVRADLGTKRTRAGMVMGTLAYVAPEQATADRVDGRADLYALSAVAYELLTREPVARGKDARAMVRSILSDTPRPLQDLRSDVPSELADLIHRGLAKDPRSRFADANAYLAALEPLAGDDDASIAAFVAAAFPELTTQRSRWLVSNEGEPTQIPTRAEVAPPSSIEVAAPPRRTTTLVLGAALAALGLIVTYATVASNPPQVEPASPIAAPKPSAPGVVQHEVAPPPAPPPPKAKTTAPPRRDAPPAPSRPADRARATPPSVESVEEHIADLDARLRRLASRGVDVQELRARLRFIRAAGTVPSDVIARTEHEVRALEVRSRNSNEPF